MPGPGDLVIIVNGKPTTLAALEQPAAVTAIEVESPAQAQARTDLENRMEPGPIQRAMPWQTGPFAL